MTTTIDSQPATRGDIFGTPSGLIVRVKRVGQAGWADVQIIGGERDGYSQRMRHGIPTDWSRYPRP
jgi:hypothetical protein